MTVARLRSLSLAALVALSSGAPLAHAQAAPEAAVQPAGRWWSSMRDATLNLLLSSASQGVEKDDRVRVEAGVAADYIAARYATLRWVAQSELADVAARRLALLQAQGAEDETMRDARRLLDEARTRSAQLEQRRMEHLQALSQRVSGLSAPTLAALLEPALLDTRVARPLDIPQRLSGAVLRARPDVAAAEGALALSARLSPDDRLRLARYQQALARDIEPVPPRSAAPDAQPGADETDVVLEQARSEVATRLWLLIASVQGAERQQASYVDADQRLQQARAASERGALGEADLLAAQADLLQAAEALARAMGEANLAWVHWQASIGGTAPAAPLSAQR